MPEVGERRVRKDGLAYAEWNGSTWIERPMQGAGGRRGGAGGMSAAAKRDDDQDLEAVNLASGMNRRLEPYLQALESGSLNLGPVRNVFMETQNSLGMSSPTSRQFATLRADLEKMRNDSLRLNKGVQTEGDAQRAWNELFKNLNDEQLVASRLRQIQGYNEAAIKFHKSRANERRAMSGVSAPDWGSYEAPRQPPPRTNGASSADPRKMSDDQLRKALGY